MVFTYKHVLVEKEELIKVTIEVTVMKIEEITMANINNLFYRVHGIKGNMIECF